MACHLPPICGINFWVLAFAPPILISQRWSMLNYFIGLSFCIFLVQQVCAALQCLDICLLGFSFFDGLYLETKEGGKWRKNNLLSSSIGNTLVTVGCEL
jgi:hypothetical protein